MVFVVVKFTGEQPWCGDAPWNQKIQQIKVEIKVEREREWEMKDIEVVSRGGNSLGEQGREASGIGGRCGWKSRPSSVISYTRRRNPNRKARQGTSSSKIKGE